MNVKQFIKQHRDDWHELEQQLSAFHKKRRKGKGRDIDEFARLYQKTASHLSYSRTYFADDEVTAYLNGLVSKCHNLLYKDQVTSLKQFRHFFGTAFVGLLLEQWKFVVAAMMLFLIGGFAAFLSVWNDPLNLYTLLPSNISQAVDPGHLGRDPESVNAAIMSAEIMTNNIQVAILSFAGGITFGLLTVYLLVYNGILLGALAALFWREGKAYEFWAYIVPHGMVELTAIFIAGGAGLLMGYKLFVPGRYSRSFQLKRQAKRSVQLLLGTIPLYVIAGTIEGFITPSALSLETKYIVAFLTVIGLLLYVLSGKWLLRSHRSTANLDS
ncbi:MAG TPA: stage II sporulation protein M [Bacillales bacterium]|nr:stage II sporulation protein M [Bacillales bacterium]